MSSQSSSSFQLLDPRIQRWIWTEGWTELREVQERAIAAIVPADSDVILAAATAAGKTEAAFFPVLTNMLSDEDNMGLTLCVSPLKALINDQFTRLDQLCKLLDIPVYGWHGDIAASIKSRFLAKPAGVVLITPESLEAMLCNRGTQLHRLFGELRFIVVDELHAFIGTERGKQLQSILDRVEAACGRTVPRIGLSATLGDMRLAASYLRRLATDEVKIIESASTDTTIKVLLKAYVEPALDPSTKGEAPAESALDSVARALYRVMRGTNNLIFPNSRNRVELLAYRLRSLCDADGAPNEFWPHHGSLSKELREETERALKQTGRNATAVCTSTLELGIDIGPVQSVAQIGPPPSVASLRQRLGRSGRRSGEASVLRGFQIVPELTASSHVVDQLREPLFEFAACVSLLLEGWFEPPKINGLHLSTLVQQVLALIAQRGGVTALQAYEVLCMRGAFSSLARTDFVALLRHLGTIKLIEQESSGLLLLGEVGEPLVNHYQFYAAFSTEEEYRVISRSEVLGSLPVSTAIESGDLIVFAGRTWKVEDIDEQGKAIHVQAHRGGTPPAFGGGPRGIHGAVRRRMRELYERTSTAPFLDASAARLFEEGCATYGRLGLGRRYLVDAVCKPLIFPWQGDDVHEAISAVFKRRGIQCINHGICIELSDSVCDQDYVAGALKSLAESALPLPEDLLADAANLKLEKWDWALPDDLLARAYASLHLDLEGAQRWAGGIIAAPEAQDRFGWGEKPGQVARPSADT